MGYIQSMDRRDKNTDQDWSPQSHNLEPFKRTRTTKQQAQKDQKKVWKCKICQKEYQSYPALYTHTKQKHSGFEISSKGVQGNSDHAPVKKLKSILNQNNSKRQELERTLIRGAKSTCINLFEVLSKDFGVKSHQLRDFKKIIDFSSITEKGYQIVGQHNLPQDLKVGLDSEIFSSRPTKIGSVSFGKEILNFFGKTNVCGQLYLQLLLVDEAVAGSNVRSWEVSQKIWGKRLNFSWLQDEWRQWIEAAHKLDEQVKKSKVK